MAAPLAKYGQEAATGVQRELANVATAGGFSQESLAKALAERRRPSGVGGRNVMAFFRAKSPRGKTIEEFAAVLGVSDRHLRLVRGELLTIDQARTLIEGRVRSDVRAFLAPHLRDRALLDALLHVTDDAAIIRAVSLYALEVEREECKIRETQILGNVVLPKRIVVFLRALRPDRDLDADFRRSPMVNALASLQTHGRDYFAPDALHVIITVARGLLEAAGVDCAPLDQRRREEQAEFDALFAPSPQSEPLKPKRKKPIRRKK